MAVAFGGFEFAGGLAIKAVSLTSAPAASGQADRLSRPGASTSPSPAGQPSQSALPKPSASASAPRSAPPKRAPTPASPMPSQTQPAATTSWAFCSSAPSGTSSTLDGRFDLFNNEWNTSDDPGPQTICGNSESNWQVTSTQRAGNTAVLTYPSVQVNYNGGNGYPLSRFTTMTSSYSEAMNAGGGTDAEAAYDIWINGLNKEVMVWVDDHGQTPGGSRVATTTFSGSTWALYESSDASYMAFVREGNAPSGSVDLLAAINYLEGRGDLSASDTLWQVNFGWEICSTAGTPETFRLSNYSLDSSPSS